MLRKSPLVIGVLAALCASIGVGLVWSLPSSSEVEASTATAKVQDADQVKKSIATQFQSHPEEFSVSEASTQLGLARMEGYAVCVATVEATAEQYIAVASYIDDAKSHVAAFKKAVDLVMDQPQGMSDCDFRVISTIARVTK